MALVLLTVLPATLRGQAPAGVEFQVNSYTTGSQRDSAVAADASGDFVVVWASYGQDGNGYGVFGRRFSASGIPQASEFQINSYTTTSQYRPAVASDPNGNFVVIWESVSQDGSGWGVFGQRFSTSGVPQGSEFQVNAYTTNDQHRPRVTLDASGNFVVVWTSYLQDGSSYGIFGQRFNASGVRQGGEFRVNSYTTGGQYSPAVTSDGSGNFVVVWSTRYQDGSNLGVVGRRFNASAVAQGSEFVVNSFTTADQIATGSSVASDASGNLVVVWESIAHDGDYSFFGVFGQRFNASGTPQGSEFLINTYIPNTQTAPSVAMDKNANFVVVWTSKYQDGSSYGTFGQRFNASGIPQGSEFQINSYTIGTQFAYGLASGSDGDFVVVWQSAGQDGSGNGVFGQRYGDIIFEDAFDSGDLTRWSSTATDGGDLSVSGAAALAGTTSGLQAFVNDTNSLFVQDDTPSAENRYRARFYFDTNGFDPGEASGHLRIRLLIVQGSGLRLITIVLRRQVGAYSLEARVRRNDGTRADTGFFPISDGPHFVEFDWQRSTAPGASNGSLQLWIDNASVATLSGIDNDLAPVELARMGALTVKTGAAGTLFFDQFESRRQRLIGPE